MVVLFFSSEGKRPDQVEYNKRTVEDHKKERRRALNENKSERKQILMNVFALEQQPETNGK